MNWAMVKGLNYWALQESRFRSQAQFTDPHVHSSCSIYFLTRGDTRSLTQNRL